MMSEILKEYEKNKQVVSESEVLCCNHCRTAINEEDTIFIDNESLCYVCADEQTFICYECGERHWNDEGYGYSNYRICERCYDNHYSTCEDCGRTVHNDDLYYDDNDDYGYCHSCHQKRSGVIRSYDYKPEPLFYTAEEISPLRSYDNREGLFYGVEIEVDKGGEEAENAEELLTIGNKAYEHIYIKHDGSLNDGFEIVSHPMSLKYHLDTMLWEELFNRAIALNYRSHQTDTCGLHIHVDRKALGNTPEEQESTIARILYFIERYWGQLLVFSRRTEYQISRWANRYGLMSDPKATLDSAKKSYNNRYVCLNLQNYQTIEFRIFRGTLKYKTFLATLQLVDEICNKAKSMSDAEFQAMTWISFISGIDLKKKSMLVDYLINKKLAEMELI